MIKRLGWSALILIGIGILSAIGIWIGIMVAARQNPGNQFTRAGIMEILSRESTVYASDGKTKVGTFFEGLHRDYVPYEKIPKQLIQALVAAEDKNYFNHGGVDFLAIAVAMKDNLFAMRVKRGGSTLSQQAAKNLFGRQGRSLTAKFEEMINAYRLEHHFSKKEILEFYLNQFYVSGNGHGVGIAARYFFNKRLEELNLKQIAFIAGSVKGPNQYNPLIKSSHKAKQKAQSKAEHRVAYVLSRMKELNFLDEQQFQKAMADTLKFEKGRFRFSLTTNMVKVQKILESPEVKPILESQGVSDFMSAGLKIYTTLDPELQKASEYALNHHLSQLDIMFEGYSPPDDRMDIVNEFLPGKFYTGEIINVKLDKNKLPEALTLRFGTKEAKVEKKALQEFYRQLNRHKTGSRQLPSAKSILPQVQKWFSKGKLVYCSVPLDYNGDLVEPVSDSLPSNLIIEKRPIIQGATQILQEGKVLTNVGGFANTGYDRVNQAKRQFGSTFKPLVYAAALELGWSPLDPLPNTRQLFRLGSTFYFPKPDHHPQDTVSMAWAAKKSENLASVSLLYHLTDKLDFASFWNTAGSLGMAPESFSTSGEFAIFVRDSLGIILDHDRMVEIRYRQIVRDMTVDLIFDGRIEEAKNLEKLPYGAGFEKEYKRYAKGGGKENKIRRELLKKNFLHLKSVAQSWSGSGESSVGLYRNRISGDWGLFSSSPDSVWYRSFQLALDIPVDSLWIEGHVSMNTLQEIDSRLANLTSFSSTRYTKENLFASPDFRATVGLHYIVDFSHRLGIDSYLEPVLSFPLGVNVITLGEAANAYQSLKDGYRYRSKMTGESQLLVQKIVTADGKEIYEDFLEQEKVISEKTKHALAGMLEGVINGGTGSRARGKLLAEGKENKMKISIPAGGKTGTTNDYRNGAFVGYVAGPMGAKKGFAPSAGYTIATYAGFDDNRTMKHRGFIGTGSSVALPVWINCGQAIINDRDFHERIDFLDLDVQATAWVNRFQSDNYIAYLVDKTTGLPYSNKRDQVTKGTLFASPKGLWEELPPEDKAMTSPDQFTVFVARGE